MRTRSALIAIAILLPVAAGVSIVVVSLASGRQVDRQRVASTVLKTLSCAEADLSSNDRDWNHVNDFWTGDVKSLYTMTSAAIRGAGVDPKDPPIQLIPVETAAADADPALVPAGGENMVLPRSAAPLERYWYAALIADLSLQGTEEATYRRDTGGTPTMGKCHNTSKFGFIAFPDSPSVDHPLFFVNENNTVFQYKPEQQVRVRRGTAVPPGLENLDQTYLNWPDDSKYNGYWNIID